MQNMEYYYDFSGQKFGYPLSLSINSFDRPEFSRIKSLKIGYVLKGEYEVVTEHFTGHIKEHELLLIAPEEIHKICKQSDGENVILMIHIDFTLLPSSLLGNVRESFASMVCTASLHSELLEAFQKCIASLFQLLQKEDYNLFELNKQMMELISLASDSARYSIEKLPLVSEYNESYMKAIRFIDQHYQEDIHLEDIARTLNFSVSYTSKLFKKYAEIPFVKYLSYVRIRASLDALLEGRESIEKIAHDCGMPNVKAYTKAFKEMYGILPSAYRKQFVQNKKYSAGCLDQEMVLDSRQVSLLSHLMKENAAVLYEDGKIRLKKEKEEYVIEFKQKSEELRLRENAISLYFPKDS